MTARLSAAEQNCQTRGAIIYNKQSTYRADTAHFNFNLIRKAKLAEIFSFFPALCSWTVEETMAQICPSLAFLRAVLSNDLIVCKYASSTGVSDFT